MKHLKFNLVLLVALMFLPSSNQAQGDLDNGIYYGYQAWHLAPGDGRTKNPKKWSHWFDHKFDSSAQHLGIEMYPDMREYPIQYKTNMKFPNGKMATLYSSYDYETIDLHVKWMKQYGIKGFFLQRQLLNIDNAFQLEFRDQVMRHVIKACEKYGIKFCIMHANNDKNRGGQQFVDKAIRDWKYCVNTLKVLKSPMYMKQTNKHGEMLPVLGFWGLGFTNNRPLKPSEALEIIDFYQNSKQKYKVYVMGGVPSKWRLKPNFKEWSVVYDKLDMISPWRTIFSDPKSEASMNKMKADLAYCKKKSIDYNPVVTPGASAATQQKKTKLRNWKKRDGGKFFWNQVCQVTKLKKEGSKFMYAAMFDEVDEGTAFYKMAETPKDVPVGTRQGFEVIPLNEDGYNLPSDWYLRLAGEAQKMFEGSIPYTEEIPIKPNEDYPLQTIEKDSRGGKKKKAKK